jgi:arylsulfatase A-like enzyme
MPFLESLVNESDVTVYENAVTPSIWTFPVHASVFTGQYPPRHGAISADRGLDETPTLAERLSEEGYATRAFYSNAWFSKDDLIRGFGDETKATWQKHNDGRTLKGRVGDLVGKVLPPVQRAAQDFYYDTYQEMRAALFPDDAGVDATTVSDARTAMADVEDPFCWFVHLNDVHWPYTPPRPYHKEFTDESLARLFWSRFRHQNDLIERKAGIWTGDETVSREVLDTLWDLYLGCARHVDTQLERLVDGLKARGVWDKTIFIVFADHGENFGEDGQLLHRFSVSDSLINVPLIVRDPTGRMSGQRVTDAASLTDIYPTVLDLTDTPAAAVTDGETLLDGGHEYAYTYYDEMYDIHDTDMFEGLNVSNLPPTRQYVVRKSPTEKLVWFPDLDEFAGPSCDDEQLRAVLQSHYESIRNERDDGESEARETRNETVDKEVEERIRDMGYLE